MKNRQYDLPSGSVGKELVGLLAEEVTKLGRGEEKSKRLIVFLVIILQKDGMVKKVGDVRRLLKKRIEL